MLACLLYQPIVPTNHSPWSPKYLATAQGGNQQAGWHKYTWRLYTWRPTLLYMVYPIYMKTSQYTLLTLCEGNPQVTCGSPHKGPVTLLHSISHQMTSQYVNTLQVTGLFSPYTSWFVHWYWSFFILLLFIKYTALLWWQIEALRSDERWKP